MGWLRALLSIVKDVSSLLRLAVKIPFQGLPILKVPKEKKDNVWNDIVTKLIFPKINKQHQKW